MPLDRYLHKFGQYMTLLPLPLWLVYLRQDSSHYCIEYLYIDVLCYHLLHLSPIAPLA